MTTEAFPALEELRSARQVRELGKLARWQAVSRARRSPFYSARLPRMQEVEENWLRIALTTKEDLRAAYPWGLLATDRNQVPSYHESSGTSGEPTGSFLTDSDWREVVSRFGRNAISIRSGDVVFVKTPYSMATTAHQMHALARAAGALVIPGDNRTSMMPYTRVVRILRDLDVTVTWSLPQETLLWALAALENGISRAAFPALRAMFVAGEHLTEARRKVISKAWGGIAVWQDYGSTETCSLAGECSASNLHFWADRLYPEIYDPVERRVSSCGTGELVVTSLWTEAMPLIRYNTGDWVSITEDSCSCGSPLPRIHMHGRNSDRVRVGRSSFLPSALDEAIYAGAGYELLFWRARLATDHVDIEYESPHVEEFAPAIRAEVFSRLGVEAQVKRLASGSLIRRDILREPMQFAKPKFLFRADEPWNESRLY